MNKQILVGVGLTCLAWLSLAEPALAQRGGYGYGGRSGYGYGNYGSGYGSYGGYGLGNYGYGGLNNYGRVNVYYNPGAGVSLGYGLGYGLTYYPTGVPNYGGFAYSFPAYNPAPVLAGGFAAPAPTRYNVFAPAFADTSGNGTSGFGGGTGVGTGAMQSFYAGPMPTSGPASIRVLVPAADAQVTFDGTPTKQQGTDRAFVTQPLPAGQEGHYTVTASWVENGQPVRRERRITVSAGAQVTVNFQPDSK